MTGHSHVRRGERGMTMVELIVVMVLMGLLGAIGISRFFDRTGFDADAFAEQTRAMLRYAQKVAVARNSEVSVRLNGSSIALCLGAAANCGSGSRVLAPAGANSGNGATRAACGEAAAWYCEGLPQGVGYQLAGASAYFFFDALGRPHTEDGPLGQALTLTISGDGITRSVLVEPETGYVH